MGLAPYGEPKYADLIQREADRPEARRQLLRWTQSYFNYCQGLTMTGREVRTSCSAARRASRTRGSSSGTWTWPPASRR